jgi:asparagine synthase (glutamine-hydrolysing)
MCGIFGYWDRSRRPLEEGVLRAMAQSLVHRGPDDEGIWHPAARGVAIGNRRLSIIDIGGGHQPFVSDDGQIAVVQNGEIFNHVELAAELRAQGVLLRSASDTEVILRLYEREGIACLKRLNGMFAIAIDDAREDALYLARDRIGVKPLYVMDDGQRMLFASEIKAFWQVPSAPRSSSAIDLEAIHHYLTFNYIPAPWTAYQGVKHVMPGTWMKFTRGAPVETRRWWSLADQREQDFGFDDWAEQFMALLDDATRIRLRADVPFGAFLSGGVDSSTIVGLMARHVDRPVKTFCIGFADPRYDESAFALQAAQRFGCEHTSEIAELNMLAQWPRVLHHLDQPHGDASFMPTLRVSELAARHVKVVLTGDGGDELFAGYDKYAAFFAQPDSASLSADAFQRRYFDSISLFPPAAKLALYRPEVRRQLDGHRQLHRRRQALVRRVAALRSHQPGAVPGHATAAERQQPGQARPHGHGRKHRGAYAFSGLAHDGIRLPLAGRDQTLGAGRQEALVQARRGAADRRRSGAPKEADVHRAGGRLVPPGELCMVARHLAGQRLDRATVRTCRRGVNAGTASLRRRQLHARTASACSCGVVGFR